MWRWRLPRLLPELRGKDVRRRRVQWIVRGLWLRHRVLRWRLLPARSGGPIPSLLSECVLRAAVRYRGRDLRTGERGREVRSCLVRDLPEWRLCQRRVQHCL